MTHKINKVCLLIGRETVPDWFADAVRTLSEYSDIRIPLVVVTESIKSPEASDAVQQRSKLNASSVNY